MNTLEERLSEALRARAELVQVADLRPADVPKVGTPSPWRRPATYGLLAAACAAVVAVPVGLSLTGGDDDSEPAPPGEGADWPVADRISLDLDGDRTEESVRLRIPVDEPLAHAVRIEADLSSGGTVQQVITEEALTWSLHGPVDLDNDGGEEILLWREHAEGLDHEFHVFTLRGGRLVEVDQPSPEPIASTIGDRRERTWWIESQTLFSARSVEQYPLASHSFDLPEKYRVDVWRWVMEPEDPTPTLVPVDEGEWCVDTTGGTQEHPMPCVGEGGGPEGSPAFWPGPSTFAGPGESFTDDTPGGRVTVALVGEAVEEMDEGDVELVVTLPSGDELRAPLPAGMPPYVEGAVVDLGETWGVLVNQVIGDTPAVQTAWGYVDGSMVHLLPATDDVPFGTVEEGGTISSTWVSADGVLYTRRSSAEPEPGPSEVWSWIVDGAELVPEDVGTWCFDFLANPTTWASC